MAQREQVVYGGYVQYPLAPKDIKNITAMLPDFAGAETLFEAFLPLFQSEMGVKIEPSEGLDGFKVVLYNLTRYPDDDNHAYYISGESDSLAKAFVVALYKFQQCSKEGMSKWVSTKPKGEFR